MISESHAEAISEWGAEVISESGADAKSEPGAELISESGAEVRRNPHVADACWCFDLPDVDGTLIPARTVHTVHMATLRFEFCAVATTDDVITEASANELT